MKRTKIVTAICVLAVLVLLGVFALPTTAQAATTASGTCGDNLTWTLDNTGTLTISGTGPMWNWLHLNDAPWDAYSVKSIVIGNRVTSIGEYAFDYCWKLTNVTIGNSVESIGNHAFLGCQNLTRVTIPDSVTSIHCAFSYCDRLTGIWVDGNNANYSNDSYGVLFDKDKTTLIQAPGGISGSYTIPDSVTSIGDDAFYGCYSLTSVTIPDSVTSIGSYAFFSCDGLTSVSIPNSVTSIGDGAFYNCDSLTSVSIPNSVTSIGNSVFNYCDSLTYNRYNNAKYLGNANNPYVVLISMTSSSITDCTIHPDTKFICSSAFSDCTNLTDVIIPDSVTSIGDYAFEDCTSLTSVTIPDSVTSIGGSAFYGCDSLTSVTIGDSVTSIGGRVFYNCYRLTSVTIPDSVTTIGSDAFSSCSCLTDVYITDPNTWCKISFGDSDANPMSYGDCLHILDDNGNEVTELVLDNTVTAIPSYAFRGSAITAVTIPDSVTSIGDYAFRSCSSLTGIWVDENNANYSSDNRGVLFNKDKTTLIQAPGGISGSYTIPDSITSIGSSAFSYCTSLTSVTIPDSVTTIDSYAFYECTSLTDVYYAGTQSQWESISIGSSNERLTSATIHYQHIHDYTLFPSVTVDPTCTQNGYTEYTCVWGDTDRQTISALGHNYTVFVETVAPTCLTEGYTTYKCSRCTATNTDYVEALDHDYTVLAETVAPTCLDGGYSVYRCVRCEEMQTRDQVSALDHDYTVHVETVAPTCLDGGYSVYRCVRCEQTQTRDQVSALGHDYSGTVTLVEPTCKDQGYTGTQCIRCDSVQKTNITNVVAHKLAILPAVDPTCTEPGLTIGTACKWCGLVGVAQKEVAALGGNCDFTADPTTCSNCGYVRADVVITNVVLRPSCSGLYFKGGFTFGAHETVSRYGIAVSLYNNLPVADDSDATSLYTVGENSVLISNILGEGKNGRDLIYARPYVLLDDGTYIYGDVVVTNLKSVVETIDAKFDTLTTAQQTVVADLYRQNTAAMQDWLIPKIKELV